MSSVAYYSGHHDHWKLLGPRSTTYVLKSGATKPLIRPECDGLRFAYTEDDKGPAPTAPRGTFFIVMVNDVLLDRPVQVVDGGRHLGFKVDGTPRWFGPKPTPIDDGPAIQLLEDAIVSNPLKRKVLEPLRALLHPVGAASSEQTAGLDPGLGTLVEKAANDAGFDLALPVLAGWLGFSSTQAPVRVWVSATAEGLRLALSMAPVAEALRSEGARDAGAAALPEGAVQSIGVEGVQALYGVLRRAFALSRSLPDTPLQRFKASTAAMPRATEAERLVVQRVGQGFFRQSLIDYWGSKCAVTGLAIPELLRASHIKPWADCETDDERLDVFNGLLLAPHLDALFDGGWITVQDDGSMRLSTSLDPSARTVLGLTGAEMVTGLTARHQAFLAWHRARVYRGG